MVVVVVVPPAAERRWRATTALSGGCLPLAEEPLRLLLRHAECPANVAFGALAAALPRPALAGPSLSDHSSAILASPPSRRRRLAPGGYGAVERPRDDEVWVVPDLVRRHVTLGERRAATSIAPVVPCLLSSYALRLWEDDPWARGTAATASSEVVEEAACAFLIAGGNFPLTAWRWRCGRNDGASRRLYRLCGGDAGSFLTRRPNLNAAEVRGRGRPILHASSDLDAVVLCRGKAGSSFIGRSGDAGSCLTRWRDGYMGFSFTRAGDGGDVTMSRSDRSVIISIWRMKSSFVRAASLWSRGRCRDGCCDNAWPSSFGLLQSIHVCLRIARESTSRPCRGPIQNRVGWLTRSTCILHSGGWRVRCPNGQAVSVCRLSSLSNTWKCWELNNVCSVLVRLDWALAKLHYRTNRRIFKLDGYSCATTDHHWTGISPKKNRW